MERVEFVVVGGGLLGLASARALGRRGREAIVLEAATVGNERAGSKGTARIFRYGYEDPFYVRLAMRAHAMWQELESGASTQLLVPTGQLNFGTRLDELEAAMSVCKAPCERIPADEVARRYPAVVPRHAIFEPASAVLRADRCLSALRSSGAPDVREHTPVRSITDEGDGVRVATPQGRIAARTAIICAGAGTASLAGVSGMPAQRSTLEQVAYLASEPAAWPIVIDRAESLRYGLPDPGGEGAPRYKLGLHHRGSEVDPATATNLEDDQDLLDELRTAARANFPEWEGDVVASERCFYDTTANEDFVLDREGAIVVGCGTSGHGFKFGPLLGELLADLATSGRLDDAYARFRLSRGR